MPFLKREQLFVCAVAVASSSCVMKAYAFDVLCGHLIKANVYLTSISGNVDIPTLLTLMQLCQF